MRTRNETLRRQTKIGFIEAATELIDEYGIENVTIRMISQKFGLHNSTIYRYFRDADQLLLLASLKYFSEYSHTLYELSSSDWNAKENFYFVWDCFTTSMLKQPQIFYHFFFGKHGADFSQLTEEYYDLFPEERDDEQNDYLPNLYMSCGADIIERCLTILQPLVSTDTKVNAENLQMINELTVSYMRYILYQKCQDPELDSDMLKKKMMDSLHYLVG